MTTRIGRGSPWRKERNSSLRVRNLSFPRTSPVSVEMARHQEYLRPRSMPITVPQNPEPILRAPFPWSLLVVLYATTRGTAFSWYQRWKRRGQSVTLMARNQIITCAEGLPGGRGTVAMHQQSTAPPASSSVTWDSLEAWVRERIQGFIQPESGCTQIAGDPRKEVMV